MKRVLFIFTLVFLISQATTYGQISLRPQVGVNFASFSDDLLGSEWTSNVGYQIGADLQIGSTFYVQPGINYMETTLNYTGVGDVVFTQNRLNIPVVLGFKLFEQENASFGLRVFAGPNMALHLGEDFEEAIQGLSADDIKSAHFSAIAGAGFDISILFVDFLYQYGLGKYIETDNAETGNNIFCINAGIRVGF